MVVTARSVLVYVDVQRDFYEAGAPACVDGTTECIPAMSRIAQAFRLAGRPIVHVVRLYLADGSNAEPVRRPMLETASIVRPGTSGSQLPEDLLSAYAPPLDPALLLGGGLQEVGQSEWVMYKPRLGCVLRHLPGGPSPRARGGRGRRRRLQLPEVSAHEPGRSERT